MNRVSVSCAPQDPAPPGVSSNRYHVATVLTRYRQYPCPNNLYIGAQPALVPCYPPTRALARTTCS